jgi:hypothetical protein
MYSEAAGVPATFEDAADPPLRLPARARDDACIHTRGVLALPNAVAQFVACAEHEPIAMTIGLRIPAPGRLAHRAVARVGDGGAIVDGHQLPSALRTSRTFRRRAASEASVEAGLSPRARLIRRWRIDGARGRRTRWGARGAGRRGRGCRRSSRTRVVSADIGVENLPTARSQRAPRTEGESEQAANCHAVDLNSPGDRPAYSRRAEPCRRSGTRTPSLGETSVCGVQLLLDPTGGAACSPHELPGLLSQPSRLLLYLPAAERARGWSISGRTRPPPPVR